MLHLGVPIPTFYGHVDYDAPIDLWPTGLVEPDPPSGRRRIFNDLHTDTVCTLFDRTHNIPPLTMKDTP